MNVRNEENKIKIFWYFERREHESRQDQRYSIDLNKLFFNFFLTKIFIFIFFANLNINCITYI